VIFDDLRAIQLRHGFLPKAELEALSARTQTPLYQIHSVASFYPHFHLAPPARAELRVCADMSCHLNAATELRAELERRLGNTRTGEVEIRDVSCLGRCDRAPAIAVNDHIFAGITAAQGEALVRAALAGDELRDDGPEQGRLACASDPYPDGEGYGALRALVATRDFDAVRARLA